jgi:pilus assembly protein CpaC
VLGLVTWGASAQQVSPPVSNATRNALLQSEAEGDLLHIPIGRSTVLTAASDLRKIYVGNPDVVRSYTSGQREVVLTARAAGVSTLVLWDVNGGHRLYTIACEVDSQGLGESLVSALPGSDIHVESVGGKLVLSGSVPTLAASEAAIKLASLYGKDVVNSLRVVEEHAKQVELKLRIIEVDRTKLEQMGINFFSGGKNTSSTGTGQFGATAITPNPTGGGLITLTDPLNLLFFNSALNVGVNISDLEQKEVLQVLAEPTLTTMSGQQARFLSGGEFPFPVVQGGTANSTAVTIVFKPYGVKVDFLPIVNPDGSIHLKVNPEVSTLDYSNAVTISGFTIPAISTRRAETEVEIRDGQSFVVSGLLDHRVTDNNNKVPGLGDIPLLGQIFRSKSLQRSTIELVVLVTANIVDPLAKSAKSAEPQMPLALMDTNKFDSAVKKDEKTRLPTPVQEKADQP